MPAMPRSLLLACALLALASPLAAQRYSRPTGDPSAVDTTVQLGDDDVVRVTALPRMGTGLEVCGAVVAGMQWGKMLFARTDAERSGPDQTVVTFPSGGGQASCRAHRAARGEWLVVSFSRPVRDEIGRVARLPVGQIVLPLAPLQGKRVVFTWLREGPFTVPSVTPPPQNLGPP
jgi:hypothetical protein